MLLREADRTRLRDELARRLDGPVDVTVHFDDSAASGQALQLAEELSSLSESLRVRTRRGAGRYLPALTVAGRSRGTLGFTGLPTGYEFPTLIDAIYGASTGETELSAESIALVSALEQDLHIRVFTAPT